MKSSLLNLACGVAMLATVGCATCDECTVCEDPAIPAMHPLGAVSQAHYDAMQANGEAADFVISEGEFEPNSADLSPSGRDHILEVGARMGGTPFPILVEPSSSANPQIDQMRRDMVVRVLTDLGNADAGHRTVISRPYSDGISGAEAVSQ